MEKRLCACALIRRVLLVVVKSKPLQLNLNRVGAQITDLY